MNYSTLLGLNGLGTTLPVLNLTSLNPSLSLGLSLPTTGLLNPLKPGYEQTGPVYNGPGSLLARQSFMLMKLELEQREAIDRAKKYAMEESIKSALAKQTRQQQLQQSPAAKKTQTLNLLSRIYVGSISYELKEDSIKLAFQPFGPIRTVTMSWDAATQKHKGFAFIEFEYPEAAHLAVEQMNNTSLGGRQLKVGRPSNLPQAEPLINELVAEYKLEKKIYVAGVHPDLSEDDLALVFEAFGKITSCKLHTDPTKMQKHRGFGYIEYESEQSANDAVASMNMFDLGGQFLRVGKAIAPPEDSTTTNSSNIPTAAALAAASATAKIVASETEDVKGRSPGSAGTVGNAGSNSSPTGKQMNSLSWDRIEAQESVSDMQMNFDDDDGGTLEHQENFHIRGRDARNVVMQKLIRPPPRGALVLRNMVGPDECDDELENEVADECRNYGVVEKVIIYQELDETGELIIKIFVVFQDSEAVDRAIASLNGRYFAGRQVIAERYDLDKFDANDLTG
ncbi:Poly-U binding splicing factor half-pint family [Paragonimus heterotremus]|uniref:Poly-U binding splicing factor half-pint family n=1 Tax=Paragonimus heterotremus TaxID=100268 RepID=A0A8J4T9U0_9TREM|nr:Poly-U binding splicing factor half-pint family [Paragonimus heterotremus]